MADEPITLETLVRFHREILAPDVTRIVDGAIAAAEQRQSSHLDAIYQRFDRLETDYHMLVAGLSRVEERLTRMEQRLDKVALRSELTELRSRIELLEKRLAEL